MNTYIVTSSDKRSRFLFESFALSTISADRWVKLFSRIQDSGSRDFVPPRATDTRSGRRNSGPARGNRRSRNTDVRRRC